MSSSASSGGMGPGGVLFVIFLVLKLVGVIHWSWWWVTSPLWINAAVWALCFAVALGIASLPRSKW